jgi:AraC-like DNA-binding protein
MNAAHTASSSSFSSRIPAVKDGSIKNGSGKKTSAKNGFRNGTSARVAELLPAVQQERLQRILEVIASGRPCTIQALAQEFNLSHSHLQHLFKQLTGARLGRVLTEQRLHHAAHLLRHSNMRIKEIAQSAGYEHTSSFIRAFERYFSQAPGLYRSSRQNPARQRAG